MGVPWGMFQQRLAWGWGKFSPGREGRGCELVGLEPFSLFPAAQLPDPG